MQILLTIILLVLPLVWIITDPRSVRERIKAYINYKQIIVVLAEILIIILTLFSSIYFPLPNIGIDNLITFLGLVLFFIGMVLAIWAKITMKSKWNMPAQHDIKRQNQIIKKGPFLYSRNPIYLGLILVFLGYPLALKSYSILLIPFIILYFYKAVLKEEKILTKYFGKDYLQYKSQVPRFF